MNQERFKELETHVDAFLEAFQKNAKIKTSFEVLNFIVF